VTLRSKCDASADRTSEQHHHSNSIAMHILKRASVKEESPSKDIIQAPSRNANAGQVIVLLATLNPKKEHRSSMSGD
jgi:hypothetical protein